jgi:hypothetical protein
MIARLLFRGTMMMSVALIAVATLVLAACGASDVPTDVSTRSTPPGSAATSAPTADAPTPGRSTPTVTNVTIATDSQSYHIGDMIHVTIINHLRTPVYAVGGKMNCTVVEAEMKTGQGWRMASIAPCGDAEMSEIVQIAPGASRAVTLASAGAVAFSPGTYRLALSYSTYSIPPQMSAPLNGGVGHGGSLRPLAHPKSSPLETVYSPAFAIQ